MTIEITREIAAKVLTTVDAGLVKGVGDPVPGKMCVEAAVCYAMGLPHGDNPDCVSPVLRSLKIRLNDSAWSSNEARGKGLRRLALVQLGSAGALDEKQFLERVVEMTISKIVPRAMRSAAKRVPAHAASLEQAAVTCEQKPTRDSALKAMHAAADYAHADAAVNYAADAAAHAADAADDAVADYAADAADDAAHAADYAAKSKARDESLAFFAEEVVKILIEMRAPGCQWLDLAPLGA